MATTTRMQHHTKEEKKAFAKAFMAARLGYNDGKGISQIKLAKATGISNSTISNYEVGKTMPDEKNVKKLIKVLPELAALLKGDKPSVKKTSLIEESRVSPDQARVAFMKTLVSASQGLKELEAQAERAGIPKAEARAMLKELGVSLDS